MAGNTFSWNKWTSVVVGNFCTAGAVNVSGNTFNESTWDAVEVLSCWRPAPAPQRHLYVGHNRFLHNSRLGLVVSPAVGFHALVEHNLFRHHQVLLFFP